MKLEWAQAARALPGQTEIGDAAWTKELPDRVRVAVMDGLGHGYEAAAASELACECLDSLGPSPLDKVFGALDMDLARSRGAAVSMADLFLAEDRLEWGGVGNVEGVLVRGQDPVGARERMLVQSGIVGNRLPRVRVRSLPLAAGDHLVFYSDGLLADVMLGLDPALTPQQNADAMLQAYAKPSDDALIWVGRLHG